MHAVSQDIYIYPVIKCDNTFSKMNRPKQIIISCFCSTNLYL